MKKYKWLLNLLILFCVNSVSAQKTDVKKFPANYKIGQAYLLYSYGEYQNGISSRIYVVNIPKPDYYYLSALTNMQEGENFSISINNRPTDKLVSQKDGWQYSSLGNAGFNLPAGQHEIKFIGTNAMVPMIEDITLNNFVNFNAQAIPENIKWFLQKDEALKKQPVFIQPSSKEVGDITNLVLPNPEGNYDHAVDMAFNYTHYSTIYLTAGNHTFTTSGSTISRALTVFNPTNYQYSWSNVNSGPGGESGLYLYVGLEGYYTIMLRPTTNGQTGTTNIILDGSTIVSGASIGGTTYTMSSLKGGALNFFTCRLQGGDTRMLAMKHFSSSARGYNDDYATSGDWGWGLASRIKKDFGTDSVRYGFVCAYSPAGANTCDVYLGNENSDVYNTNYPEFPLLKSDDAIKTAPNTTQYNCTSWAGGITSTWVWPPSWSSTYNCSGSSQNIDCFDNYFGNIPVARYPGAWNYTRTGATAANAVVDLWKLNTTFTHGSVKKPGNNHPHGYDWESKPGQTTRTLHPRNALTNTSYGYGAVSNYYKPTGTYAFSNFEANIYALDEDAIKAGIAVIENAKLTSKANEKLDRLIKTADKNIATNFDELYNAWKKTWESNSIYSDPDMYCRGDAFDAMANFANSNKGGMYLVFEKYVNGDNFIGKLVWSITRDKYSQLLQEAKEDILRNPYNEEGKFKIHGDHDNGVRYIEKILNSIDETPVVAMDNSDVKVSVYPNPIKDMVTVNITTTSKSKVSVQLVSIQTNRSMWVQTEKEFSAGQYRFTASINSMGLFSGDIVAIKVKVGDNVKTLKAMILK